MATLIARIAPVSALAGSRAPAIVERNLMVYRRGWLVLVSGFFEPLFYLFALGVGLGALVGDVVVGGRTLSYTAFVAPAMLAASAMNGAIFDATFNIFHKLKYAKVYDAVLSTPMGPRDVAVGEVIWALMRGLLYSGAFLVVMVGLGLVSSPWAVLVLPVAVLIGFAFAAVGMAATTYMRGWQDFEWVQLATLPMFLLSATFYPLETYPPGLRVVVEWSPLYQGVALVRALSTGAVDWALLVHAAYLGLLGLLGVVVSARRLERLLLR